MKRKTRTPLWLRLLNGLVAADQRYRQSARLRDMPDFLLEDMGITRAEADRAFLQSPFDRPGDREPMPLARRA